MGRYDRNRRAKEIGRRKQKLAKAREKKKKFAVKNAKETKHARNSVSYLVQRSLFGAFSDKSMPESRSLWYEEMRRALPVVSLNFNQTLVVVEQNERRAKQLAKERRKARWLAHLQRVAEYEAQARKRRQEARRRRIAENARREREARAKRSAAIEAKMQKAYAKEIKRKQMIKKCLEERTWNKESTFKFSEYTERVLQKDYEKRKKERGNM